MPAIALSTDELALLRRCFAAAKPLADGWEDLEDGDQIPISVEAAASAATILAQALEAEPEAFLAEMAGLRQAHGRERVVGQGNGPDRAIQTRIGPVTMRRLKLRDHGAGQEEAGEERARIDFASALLPGSHPRR